MRIPLERLRLTLILAVLSVGSGLIYFGNAKAYEAAPYQAGIARSMSMSFSNWLFGAVDPLGTVSLDKIPGSYWIPAIFVKIIGFHTASVIVPNGLATIGTVIVMALAGRRVARAVVTSDAAADMIALATGAIIIATPIIAAVARSNEPESFFLLLLALAFHRAIVALQTGSRKQLIFAGLWIAAAFQTYMIEAWVLWPAIIVAWFALSGKSKLKKLADLAVAGGISLFASLLWIIAVTVTPASARPYVGGTFKNSAWEMVFGYNALGRLSATSDAKLYRSFTPKFAGNAGILRLFNPQDAGQIGWLIAVAAIAVVVLVLTQEFDATLVLIGTTLVLFFLEYSFVAGMHQYYTAIIAIPMVAAIAYLAAHGRGWTLILIGLAGVASEFLISSIYPGYFSWTPFVAFGLVGALVLLHGLAPTQRGWLALVLTAALIATPLAWSIDTMNRPNSTNPVAGPPLRTSGHPGLTHRPRVVRTAKSNLIDSKALIKYVRANETGHPRYPLAVFGAQISSIITNATGVEVLPIGGFSGFDAVPTASQFKKLVADNQAPFVIMGASFTSPKITGNTRELTSFITNHCSYVSTDTFGPLYHCAP